MKLPTAKKGALPAPAPAVTPGRRRWYTTGQAAKKLGYDRSHIFRLCRDGKIPAQQAVEGGEWRIPAEWVEERLEAAKAKVVRRKKKS